MELDLVGVSPESLTKQSAQWRMRGQAFLWQVLPSIQLHKAQLPRSGFEPTDVTLSHTTGNQQVADLIQTVWPQCWASSPPPQEGAPETNSLSPDKWFSPRQGLQGPLPTFSGTAFCDHEWSP